MAIPKGPMQTTRAARGQPNPRRWHRPLHHWLGERCQRRADLREIATSPDYYYQSPLPSDLDEIYNRLASEIRNVSAANIDLTNVVAPEFEIVPNSFSGAAVPQVNGQSLTWKLPSVSEGSTEVSFSVRPTKCGTFAVNSSASAQYDDNRGTRRTLTFPVPTVTVDGCSPVLTDIFIRDNDTDHGQLPSDNPWWVSPDIWIRHADDGGTQHLNPEAGQRNYIYARVWNRGTTTVTDIDVDFYFANPGLGLTWPNDWTILPVRAGCILHRTRRLCRRFHPVGCAQYHRTLLSVRAHQRAG